MKTTKLFLIGLLGLTAMVYSCKKDDSSNNNNNNNNNSTSGVTNIQFVNGAPNYNDVDIYPNGLSSPTLVGAYYQFGSDYGRYDFTNDTVAFGLNDFTHGRFLNATLQGGTGQVHTFFLYDSLGAVHYLYIADTVPTTTDPDKGAVKFVNLSPGSGPLSYRIKGGATVASNVTYAGADSTHSHTSFLPIDSGYQVIEVVNSSSQVVDSLATYVFHVKAGESYTIFTSGIIGASYPNGITSFWTKDEIVQ